MSDPVPHPGPTEILVFGAFRGPGHYLRHPNGRLADVPEPVRGAVDSIYRGFDRDQPEGHRVRLTDAAVATIAAHGYSYVSWWDRRGDERRGSHTGILAPGTWTPAQLVDAGRRLAPWAFRVEVVAHA